MAASRCLRLLTFDVTNTIIRVKGSPGYWYARAGEQCGVSADPEKLDAIHTAIRKVMKVDHPHYGYAHGMTPKEWWSELVCRVFTAAGHITTPEVFDQIGDSLYSIFTGGGCYDAVPGSHEMLTQLKEQGLKLGVISNFDERLQGVLEDHGFSHYFDFLVTSVSSRCEKPAPKIFQDALKAAKMAPHNAGHIGDDVINDYWAAHKVGFKPFLFDPKHKLTSSKLEGVDKSCIFHDHSELSAKILKFSQSSKDSL